MIDHHFKKKTKTTENDKKHTNTRMRFDSNPVFTIYIYIAFKGSSQILLFINMVNFLRHIYSSCSY